MKLIATLATLAALIGQTQAGTGPTLATAITATHDQIGTKLCTDKITLKADTTDTTAVTQSKAVKFVLPDGFSIDTFVAIGTTGTQIDSILYGTTEEKSDVTSVAYDAATNTISFTGPSDGAAGALITLKLVSVCNHMTTITSGKYSWTAKSQNVKFQLTDADDALVTSTDETATSAAHPTALKDVLLKEIPAAGAEGAFKILFTAPAAASAQKFGVNLPKGFTYKSGNVCKLGPAAAPVAFDASTGDSASPIEFYEYTTDANTGASITAAALAFECTKVKAPATLPTAKLGDVAIRYGAADTAATHVGYATSTITKSPTAKPTAKPDDSPASVATASGVVVGALGVAALFLA